jgi:hypothetical protein
MKVGTGPVRTTIGIESSSASAPALLVALGPDVTSATPGLPVDRARSLGGVDRALPMAHKNMLNRVLLKNLVTHKSAGQRHRVAKDRVNALIYHQSFNYHFRTSHVEQTLYFPCLSFSRVRYRRSVSLSLCPSGQVYRIKALIIWRRMGTMVNLTGPCAFVPPLEECKDQVPLCCSCMPLGQGVNSQESQKMSFGPFFSQLSSRVVGGDGVAPCFAVCS